MKSKNLALHRFADIQPITTQFNPVTEETEDWRKPFNPDFTQPASRIACLGSDEEKLNKRRCTILARASKKQNGSQNELELLNWIDCIKLFETILSIEINDDILFYSHTSSVCIKDHVTYKKSELS